MTSARSQFRAMNTDIELLAPGDAGPAFEAAAGAARSVFAEVEGCLSRFRPDSELSALNWSAGRAFSASRLLFSAVSMAVDAAGATGGIFDPTVLSALESAGYDRSFERLSSVPAGRSAVLERSPLPDYRAIVCDRDASTIQLTEGQRIDLGGIGKGLAVDLALAATGTLDSCCINAGGDIAARGSAGPEGGWTVAIEDTGNSGPLAILLRDAALATSTSIKRRWTQGDDVQHHLIDPRTGRPSTSPLRSVTVMAATCVQADVAAKTALLLGESGMDFLADLGLHGFAVQHDGSTVRTALWPRA